MSSEKPDIIDDKPSSSRAEFLQWILTEGKPLVSDNSERIAQYEVEAEKAGLNVAQLSEEAA